MGEDIKTIMKSPVGDSVLTIMLSVSDILEEIRRSLTGYVPAYNSETDSWYWQKTVDKPRLNELGVNEVMDFVIKYINRNTITSFLTAEEIHDWTYEFTDVLLWFLLRKYDKFGLTFYDIESVLEGISASVFMALKRALNGYTVKAVTGVISYEQKVQEGENKPRKKFKLPFGRGGE